MTRLVARDPNHVAHARRPSSIQPSKFSLIQTNVRFTINTGKRVSRESHREVRAAPKDSPADSREARADSPEERRSRSPVDLVEEEDVVAEASRPPTRKRSSRPCLEVPHRSAAEDAAEACSEAWAAACRWTLTRMT